MFTLGPNYAGLILKFWVVVILEQDREAPHG